MAYAVTKSGRTLLTAVKLVSMNVLSSGTLLFFKLSGLSLLLLNALSKILVFR